MSSSAAPAPTSSTSPSSSAQHVASRISSVSTNAAPSSEYDDPPFPLPAEPTVLPNATNTSSSSTAAAPTASPAPSHPLDCCRGREVELVGLRARLAEATARALEAERARRSAVQAAENAASASAAVREEVAFLRDVNETVVANAKAWEERCRAAVARGVKAETDAQALISELREEARDLMFSLETGANLAAASDAQRAEIAGGTLVVGAPPPPPPVVGRGGSGRTQKKAGGRG